MASSPSQRGLCSRPPVLLGAVLVLMFVCAVLMKISTERGKEASELDSLLIESRQTIDSTNRERDLAILARKEAETELEKIKNSKKGVDSENHKLTEEVNQLKAEHETCNQGNKELLHNGVPEYLMKYSTSQQELETARSEKEDFQQTLHLEKENADKKLEQLTEHNNQLLSENQNLQQEIDKLRADLDAAAAAATATKTTNAPATTSSSNSTKTDRR